MRLRYLGNKNYTITGINRLATNLFLVTNLIIVGYVFINIFGPLSLSYCSSLSLLMSHLLGLPKIIIDYTLLNYF